MAMAGKAQFERKRGEIVRSVSQTFQRSAQPQTHQIAMKRRPGSPPKEASQVKRRCADGPRHVIERDAFRHSAYQVSPGRLDMIGVIRFRVFPAAFNRMRRWPLARKSGLKRIDDDLKRRRFNP